MDILLSFPFDDVTVDVLTIEVYLKVCKKCMLAKVRLVREFFRQLRNCREIKEVNNSLDMAFSLNFAFVVKERNPQGDMVKKKKKWSHNNFTCAGNNFTCACNNFTC